jgi:protein TonB
MKKEKKDKNFIKKPMYPGGNAALKKFVKQELKYPKEALKYKIEGVVRLKYTINSVGNVIKSQVMISLGHGCDEEAQRVVEKLKFFVPKNRNIKVQFHKHINIPFKLPKPKKINVKYTVTKDDKANSTSNTKDQQTNYNYTISFSQSQPSRMNQVREKK